MRVYWNWGGEDDDGKPVGRVVIQRPDGSNDEWDRWVRHSVATAYADAYRYELVSEWCLRARPRSSGRLLKRRQT